MDDDYMRKLRDQATIAAFAAALNFYETRGPLLGEQHLAADASRLAMKMADQIIRALYPESD